MRKVLASSWFILAVGWYCGAGELQPSELRPERVDKKAVEGFSSQELKSQVDRAIGTIKKIDLQKIKTNDAGTPIILIEKRTLEAFRFLQASRSSEAVSCLLPLLDVRFKYVEDGIRNARMGTAAAADDALKAIGLPAIDELLGGIRDSTIEKAKLKPARKLCVDLLGEEGLRARVSYLNLSKDDKIRAFLNLK